MHKQQIIRASEDYNRKTLGAKYKVTEKGLLYCINDIRFETCDCAGNNKWRFVWLGHRYANNQSCGIQCIHCKKNMVTENKIWIPIKYFDKVETDIEKADKMQCEVSLLHLLADNKIKPDIYKKIMNYMNGDDEMLELGKQLIIKLSNET